MTEPDRIDVSGTCPQADDGTHDLHWRAGTDPAGEWRAARCQACGGETWRIYSRRHRLD